MLDEDNNPIVRWAVIGGTRIEKPLVQLPEKYKIPGDSWEQWSRQRGSPFERAIPCEHEPKQTMPENSLNENALNINREITQTLPS